MSLSLIEAGRAQERADSCAPRARPLQRRLDYQPLLAKGARAPPELTFREGIACEQARVGAKARARNRAVKPRDETPPHRITLLFAGRACASKVSLLAG